MVREPERRPGARRRRRRTAGALALMAVVVWLAASAHRSGPGPAELSRSTGTSRPRTLTLRIGHQTLARVRLAALRHGNRNDRAALAAAVRTALPATFDARRGQALITYRLDGAGTAHAASSEPPAGSVQVRRLAIAARIPAPVLGQKLRNDCEAAALQILLATTGLRFNQLKLQAQLPRSGPLDPRGSPPNQVWGDPSKGFVGRADGGGTAGGFGVYQQPIAALARRNGVDLHDLSGASPRRVYNRLLAGHAVMVWVGLGDGPYGRWRSPDGTPIKVNFNEHTVVLNGIDADGTLRVVNPLQGTRERWTLQKFEGMWARLGRLALST